MRTETFETFAKVLFGVRVDDTEETPITRGKGKKKKRKEVMSKRRIKKSEERQGWKGKEEAS